MQGPMLTGTDTIHTSHTTAIVYLMLFQVDAGSLALLGAQLAVLTFRGINDRTEQGIFGQESKNGSYRTNGIAICTPVFPSQYKKNHHRYHRHNQRRQSLHPYLCFIECIAVRPLSPKSQQVVSPLINRCQQGRSDTPV